jgi:hypothetical protein
VQLATLYFLSEPFTTGLVGVCSFAKPISCIIAERCAHLADTSWWSYIRISKHCPKLSGSIIGFHTHDSYGTARYIALHEKYGTCLTETGFTIRGYAGF